MTDIPVPPPADEPHAPPRIEMSPQECAEQLKQRFPALFTGPAKPLKLRIQADIQERAPGVFTKKALSAFLRRHTGSTSYLIAMTRAPHRFDLDGQPGGEITDEHRQVAAEELTRRRNLRQEREQQDEQLRRDRAQLLRDFERSTLTPANFCALKGLTPEGLEEQLRLAREEAAARPPLPQRPPHGDRRPDHRPGQRPGQPSARRADQQPGQRSGPRPGQGPGQGQGQGQGRRDARGPQRKGDPRPADTAQPPQPREPQGGELASSAPPVTPDDASGS